LFYDSAAPGGGSLDSEFLNDGGAEGAVFSDSGATLYSFVSRQNAKMLPDTYTATFFARDRKPQRGERRRFAIVCVEIRNQNWQLFVPDVSQAVDRSPSGSIRQGGADRRPSN
jgi:hypothetical protein